MRTVLANVWRRLDVVARPFAAGPQQRPPMRDDGLQRTPAMSLLRTNDSAIKPQPLSSITHCRCWWQRHGRQNGDRNHDSHYNRRIFWSTFDSRQTKPAPKQSKRVHSVAAKPFAAQPTAASTCMPWNPWQQQLPAVAVQPT